MRSSCHCDAHCDARAGKSSLLRVLAGLWPFEEGTVTRPLTIGPGGLFFLPQRPYLTAGTLRGQLLYPDTGAGAERANDEELVQVSWRRPFTSLRQAQTPHSSCRALLYCAWCFAPVAHSSCGT